MDSNDIELDEITPERKIAQIRKQQTVLEEELADRTREYRISIDDLKKDNEEERNQFRREIENLNIRLEHGKKEIEYLQQNKLDHSFTGFAKKETNEEDLAEDELANRLIGKEQLAELNKYKYNAPIKTSTYNNY